MSSVSPSVGSPDLVPSDTGPEPTLLTGIKVVVIGVLMQMLVIGTYLYSFTFWVQPWVGEFEVSTSEVMLLPTIYLYANALALLFLGKYLDRLPHRISVGIGLSAFSLSMFLISIAPSLEFVFLVYLLIVPFAVAFCGPVPAITLVSQVFGRRRGMAVGIVALGTSLGGMVVPHFIVFMMAEVGWRGTNQAVAMIALAIAVTAFILLGYKPKQGDFGVAEATKSKALSRSFLRQKYFWFCIIASSGAYFVFMAMQFNMAPIATEMGLASSEIAFTITIFTGGMVSGKILSGIMSEIIDPRYAYVFIGTLMIGALGVLALELQGSIVSISFFVFGLGAGSILPLKGIIFGQIFGTQNLGRVLGLAAPFAAIYSFGPPTASYLRSVFGDYSTVFLLLMALLTVTVPFVLLVKKLPVADRKNDSLS